MIRPVLFIVIALISLMAGCNRTSKKPLIQYNDRFGIIIQQTDESSRGLHLLFINSDDQDTIGYKIFNTKDTLKSLECSMKYSCYYKYENQARYSFLKIFDYRPFFCKENLSFQKVKSSSPEVNYLIQDFKQGSIYRLGRNGHLMVEFDSLAGFIRGFDFQDSLLAWCSDSSKVTIKNLNTHKKVIINFDSTIKIHHDLVLHYPYLTGLYNKKIYKEFKSYKVIEEGFIRVDLRSKAFKFWSIHDFLSDNNLPLGNAKGSFVTAHGNSIDVDPNGDYYVSLRDFSQVWKISSDLSSVLYRIGLDADSFQIRGNYFVGQHSIDIIEPDQFYLFDNGSTGKGNKIKSRIVSVSVDSKAKIYEVKNILLLPDSLSTIRMGSVHGLVSHLVVSTYNKGLHILEIDTAGVVKNHLMNTRSHAIKVLPIQ